MQRLAICVAAALVALPAAAQDFVTTHIHALAWDPVATSVLALPGFIVFLALAFLLYAIGHRPARRIGRFVTDP